MKKIKYLMIAGLAAITVTNCEYDPVIYDNVNGQTYLSFPSSTLDVAVNIGTQNFSRTQDIEISVSTISSADRTFTVSASDESTVTAGNYQLPASITVPANSYNATFTIGFQDDDLETTPETLILNLSGDGAAFDSPITLNVFEVCPIPATYMTGNYEISDISAVFQGENWDTNVVDIQASTETARTFDTTFFGQPVSPVLNLVCNELIYSTTFNTGFTTSGQPIILIPNPDGVNTSTYDLSDDTFFIVDYSLDIGTFGIFTRQFALIKL